MQMNIATIYTMYSQQTASGAVSHSVSILPLILAYLG